MGIALTACGCVLTVALLIGIGIEIPWVFLPATGILALVMGYRWGTEDAASIRKRQRKIRSRKALSVSAAGFAGGPGVSGDSYDYVRLPDGGFAVALSDGMGKGENAARESGLAVKIITGMLKAGLGPETALKLLNMTFMLHNGSECYFTMDLAVINPSGRELRIYKTGAAPTVIRRANGRIDIMEAPAMPMGVMEYQRIPCVSSMVDAGDQIIMMTDGIVDSRRDDCHLNWLRHLLEGMRSRNGQTVCDLIIKQAATNYSFREKDDMTVLVFNACGTALAGAEKLAYNTTYGKENY